MLVVAVAVERLKWLTGRPLFALGKHNNNNDHDDNDNNNAADPLTRPGDAFQQTV